MSERPLQSLSLRQATVEHLRNDPDLTALVDAASIYGMRSPPDPAWPFIRYGVPDEAPIRQGTELRVTLHAFSKEQFEDDASSIIAAIQKSLENATLSIEGGKTAYLAYVGSQIMADRDEADAWHGLITFTATIG